MGNDEVSTNNNGQARFVPATTLDEVMNIAIANGYEGAYPNNIADAVAALGTVVSGGGGEAGYDVTTTKEWVVEEQTVTTEASTTPSGTIYAAPITIVDGVEFGQLLEDGVIDFVIVVDGVEHEARNIGAAVVTSDSSIGISQNPISGSSVTFVTETEPTTHTVSCYYNNTTVTTTEDFGLAVDSVVSPKINGVVRYMGTIHISTNSNMSEVIGVNSGHRFDLAKDGQYSSMIDYDDSELVERYGEDYETMVLVRALVRVNQPTKALASFDATTPSVFLNNISNDSITIDGNLNAISLDVACFG